MFVAQMEISMARKYTVSLHIRREDDGQETTLTFDENQTVKIPSDCGHEFGQFRLVAEGVPDPHVLSSVEDGSQCLKYCTIDEGNSLAYCLAICGAAVP
jgi:hypothetical protein